MTGINLLCLVLKHGSAEGRMLDDVGASVTKALTGGRP
jgi:hypothetical protein